MCVLNGLDAKCMLSTSCRWNHFHESKKVFAEKIPVSEMFSPDFVTKSGDYLLFQVHDLTQHYSYMRLLH